MAQCILKQIMGNLSWFLCYVLNREALHYSRVPEKFLHNISQNLYVKTSVKHYFEMDCCVNLSLKTQNLLFNVHIIKCL